MTQPPDLTLSEILVKLDDITAWLNTTFDANCSPKEYDAECASCNASAAVRHLKLIDKELRWIVEG